MCRFFLLFLVMISCCAFGEEKKRIVFIVNPLSHELKGCNPEYIIENTLDLNQFDYRIVYTEYPRHASELAHDFLNSFDIIAAVGGDGTVNEVGRALINTNATLAIIPVGSGNGLARHLGIPIGLVQAIRALNHSYPICIDTAKINDRPFLGVAGIGFDAYMADRFARFGRRGLASYCKVAIQEFAHYQSQTYHLSIDGRPITRKAFILSFANSSQYGNDFIIAPKAHIADGFLDLVILDDVPAYSIPQYIYRFKHGTLDHSSHYESYRFKEITLCAPSILAHLDGEPVRFQNEIKITVQPHSLKILSPCHNKAR